jgi:hypothetical protein
MYFSIIQPSISFISELSKGLWPHHPDAPSLVWIAQWSQCLWTLGFSFGLVSHVVHLRDLKDMDLAFTPLAFR